MIGAIILMMASAVSEGSVNVPDPAVRKGHYFCAWREAVGLTGEQVPDLEICRQMPEDRIEINAPINRWWQYWYNLDAPLADRMRTRFDADFANLTPVETIVGLFRADIAVVDARGRSNREAERTAVASATHPYAGFWKREDCEGTWGLAVSPAGRPGFYSVSFCGSGGCFEPGTYRPNTTLTGDRAYRIVDKDTMDVEASDGFVRFVRCQGRAPY